MTSKHTAEPMNSKRIVPLEMIAREQYSLAYTIVVDSTVISVSAIYFLKNSQGTTLLPYMTEASLLVQTSCIFHILLNQDFLSKAPRDRHGSKAVARYFEGSTSFVRLITSSTEDILNRSSEARVQHSVSRSVIRSEAGLVLSSTKHNHISPLSALP